MKLAVLASISLLLQGHCVRVLRQRVEEDVLTTASKTASRGHSQAERDEPHINRSNVAAVADKEEASVSISRALACLRKSTPNVSLVYPADAELHVDEIREALRPWNSLISVHKVMNPSLASRHMWLATYHAEDIWMNEFLSRWESRAPGTRVRDIFGDYIPIFTQWVNPWFTNRLKYPKDFLQALRGVLRANVPYVTVSQNDEGITGKNELALESLPNILVLSAGGYGHVALPLIRTDSDHLTGAKKMAEEFFRYRWLRVPVEERRYLFSYVGSLLHAPHDMRAQMKKTVEDFAQAHNITDKVLIPTEKTETGWQRIMLNSRFNLVPRGFGRTSYHLAETLQIGLIPIHVYTDEPWVPYPGAYEELGFATTVEGLPALMERLMRLSDADVKQLEARVEEFAMSHYSLHGMSEQIASFLAGGSSELVCQRLPSSITGH